MSANHQPLPANGGTPGGATGILELDGGGSLAYRLKNLPQRHCVVKSGPERWSEVLVPTVQAPKVDYTDLLNRSRYARGRVRAHIERDIAKRHESAYRKPDDVLHAWS